MLCSRAARCRSIVADKPDGAALAAPSGLPAAQGRLDFGVAGGALVVGDQAGDVEPDRGVRDGRDGCVQAVFPGDRTRSLRRTATWRSQDSYSVSDSPSLLY